MSLETRMLAVLEYALPYQTDEVCRTMMKFVIKLAKTPPEAGEHSDGARLR